MNRHPAVTSIWALLFLFFLAGQILAQDAMHKLDARQMPAWVYRAAKWLGLRLPQEWLYFGYHTDWEHLDVGTK